MQVSSRNTKNVYEGSNSIIHNRSYKGYERNKTQAITYSMALVLVEARRFTIFDTNLQVNESLWTIIFIECDSVISTRRLYRPLDINPLQNDHREFFYNFLALGSLKTDGENHTLKAHCFCRYHHLLL